MRYLPITVLTTSMLVGIGLVGCSTTPAQNAQPMKFTLFGFIKQKPKLENTAPPNRSTLKTIDYANTDLDKNQYKLDAFSLGGWVNQKDGDIFRAVQPTDPNSAIVYLYRIDSRWNRQEILAPNFFINERRIPSLLNNHYYWVELPAGVYRMNVSHPLAILHFQEGTTVDFSVEAGQSYYLKYEEQRFRGKPDKSLGLLQKGPLMQMPTKLGLEEIRTTRLKNAGYSFVKRESESLAQNLPTFNEKDATKVKGNQLDDKEKPPVITKPFRIWNPLTW